MSFGKECFDAAVSFETPHHFKPEDKLLIFKKLYECLEEGGCYIEGDYAAESEEMEAYLFAECERRRKQSGIPEGIFVHFDTPLTLELQKVNEIHKMVCYNVLENGKKVIYADQKSERKRYGGH